MGTVAIRVSNAGDENTMAASAEQQFNVIKANQTITFDLASEINLSEGSIPLSASSSSGLVVGFSVVSGSGTISGNTLNFTEVGNIVVEASQAGDGKYNPASSVQKTISVVDGTTSIPEFSNLEFTVYPNPSNGIITIKHDFNDVDAVIKIYSSTGLLMKSENLKDNSVLDLSHLDSGVYIIKIVSKNALGSKTIIIE